VTLPTAELVDMLATIPLFASLQRPERIDLARRMYERTYQKSETIIHMDGPGNAFFVLRLGEVKVFRPLESGDEVIVGILGPGEFFGEMALLDGKPRSASVQALEMAEVLVLSRDAFHSFLRAHPTAAIEIIVVLADRIRGLNARVEEGLLDIPQRLARRLLAMGRRRGRPTPTGGIHLVTAITQGELAGMVGASRQRVNQILSQWQSAKVIQLEGRGAVTILRPDLLETFGQQTRLL
jgi:CRP/FNR family transcriptional regulator, cyclic AMP receptor protein